MMLWKKITKLALLLPIFSFVGIATSQAYKLYCPTPDSISMKSVKKQYEYSASMGRDQAMVDEEDIAGLKDENDRKITMSTLHDANLNLSSFSFQAASSSSKGELSCLYGNPTTGETITLKAELKKEGMCKVIYPDGHEHPESAYFECY